MKDRKSVVFSLDISGLEPKGTNELIWSDLQGKFVSVSDCMYGYYKNVNLVH